jgi:hypothetical protein
VSAAPGWYPDPGGQPGQFRFWDGRAWSAATTADPRTPPPGSVAPPVPGPVPPPGPVLPPTPGRRRSALPWVLGAAALVTVLVVIAVLVVRSLTGDVLGDPGPVPSGTPSRLVCPDAVVETAGPPPPQTGDRVRSGALSYARLPAPFRAPEYDVRVPFGRDVQSQNATVEQDAAGTPTWVAGVLIARLLAGDGFYGPEQGAKVVAECVTGKFYGDATVTRKDRRNEATTVDGRPAWVIEAQLSFSLPNIATTGELMVIVVVETVTGEAGLFYASIPDTSPQFVEPARKAQASLKVDG